VEAPKVKRLIGVYHADGGVLGELRYTVGNLIGRAHCALCDITHRGVSPRRQWRELAERFSVPITLVHLNERAEDVRRACEGKTPCVLGEVDGRLVVLLDRAALDACNGDVDVFEASLRKAVEGIGAYPI
jgi:hypothetical protein